MKKRIKIIFFSFLLVVSIFTTLSFTTNIVKADTNIPNRNSYMLNLQDFYLTLRATGIEPSNYIGTTVLNVGNNEELFFKVSDIWFNTITLHITVDFEMTIYYQNSYTYQRADVVNNNNIIDFNALNINVVNTEILNNLTYRLAPSQNVTDMAAIDLFNILFTNVDNSFPIRSGIYEFDYSNLFVSLAEIGYNYRVTDVPDYDSINWTYSYIIYSPNDIVLSFTAEPSIYCNVILIGGSGDDLLTLYFLKTDFSNYQGLYYFDKENTQVIYHEYYNYNEIESIYLPYNSSIYKLSSDSFVSTFSSDYVFNISFIYGYTNEVNGWQDFFINIIDVPILYLRSLTNFEIFGVNLFYTLTGILTTLFVIWVIRKF